MTSRILGLALLLTCMTSFAYAECDICKAANQKESSNYLNATGAKLAQGATNVGFSWMELGLQPVKSSAQRKKGDCPIHAALTGVPSAVGSACYRVLQGTGEIITAFWPQRVMPVATCEVCNVEEMKVQGIVS